MTVEQFVEGGVDIVINLGIRETLTANKAWTEWLTRGLRPNPLYLPMTNPDPGITPEMLWAVRPDAYYGSGNQVFPNPVNNFTAFGYIGLGALLAMAGGVGSGMTVAAARGILEVAKSHPDFGSRRLVPRPDEIELIEKEAGAVAKAAAREGLATRLPRYLTGAQLAEFDAMVDERVRVRRALIERAREEAAERGMRRLRIMYPRHFAPFFLRGDHAPSDIPAYHVAPQIDKARFEHFAGEIGISPERWAHLIDEADPTQLRPTAMTELLESLRGSTEGDTEGAKTALRELEIIVQIGRSALPWDWPSP